MTTKWIVTIRRDRFMLAWGIGGLLLGGLLLIYMNTVAWAVKRYASIIRSPSFFPMIGIWGLIGMSAILVVVSLRQIKANQGQNPATVSLNFYGLIMIGIWVGFMLLDGLIGFVPASVACILATEWLCGVNMKRLPPYLIALLAPLLFYYLFGKLLKVRFTPIPFFK